MALYNNITTTVIRRVQKTDSGRYVVQEQRQSSVTGRNRWMTVSNEYGHSTSAYAKLGHLTVQDQEQE